jgi:hypothetical protein
MACSFRALACETSAPPPAPQKAEVLPPASALHTGLNRIRKPVEHRYPPQRLSGETLSPPGLVFFVQPLSLRQCDTSHNTYIESSPPKEFGSGWTSPTGEALERSGGLPCKSCSFFDWHLRQMTVRFTVYSIHVSCVGLREV